MNRFPEKTLIFLLIVSIVSSGISFFAFMQKESALTGFLATNVTGTQSIEIQSITSIVLSDSITNFGTRSLTASNCTINTESTLSGCSGSANTDTMTVENDGNTNVRLTVNASNNITFGSYGNQSFKGTNKESGACNANLTSSYAILPMGNAVKLCDQTFYNATQDEIYINYQLFIASDAPTGNSSTNVTVWATAVG